MIRKQKWIIVLMIILIPSIILAIPLIFGGISVAEFPLWVIITIPTLILLSPLMFFLSQRYSEQVGSSIQKKRKKSLTLIGILFFFSTIILIITYYLINDYFWIILFTLILPLMLFMFFINFRHVFPNFKKHKG